LRPSGQSGAIRISAALGAPASGRIAREQEACVPAVLRRRPWNQAKKATSTEKRSSFVKLDFSRPGKSTDNAFIESFNGRLRDECLNQHWFLSLDEARAVTEALEGRLQSRSSAWCSGQPDAVRIRAAGSWACPATRPAWLTTRLVPSWGQRHHSKILSLEVVPLKGSRSRAGSSCMARREELSSQHQGL